jgi:2-hydroxy-3-keto-5-methylthiopentenyl-1-phosphate phosphatase
MIRLGTGRSSHTLVRSEPVENLLIACDFDGTITQNDTLHLIVGRYGEPGLWQAIEPRLRAGEVTLEEAMQEEFAAVRATPEQVRELVLRDAGLRPGFREFVAWVRARGHRLVVLSSGFRSVIDAVLGQFGLGDLEVTSHEARFSADGCTLVWGDRGERCAECGRRCKRHDVRVRLAGEHLVLIGDGVSDRCVARMADLVFARAHLARDLALDGVPFIPFEDFVEVREELESRTTLAA